MVDEHSLLPSEDIKELQLQECYTGLPAETIVSLEQRAVTINTLVSKASFEIGAELVAAREDYRHNKHGGFEGWIKQRLKWESRQTAYNLIWRYEQFATVQHIGQLDMILTAQYHLAAPSVPQGARDEALQRAEAGEKITVKIAKEIIEAQRAQLHAEEAEQQARAEK